MAIGMDITEYLKDYHNTEKTAIKGRDLCVLFNLHSKQLRNVVSDLRRDGKPICSSNAGYWYSEKAEDIDCTITRLSEQVKNMSRSIEGLYKAKGAVKDVE